MSDYSAFIESHLTSIRSYEKEKRAEFLFVLSSGIERRLSVDGIDRMLIHEMREINIVESIDVYDSTNSEDDLQWAVEILTTTGANVDTDLFAPVMRSVTNRVAIGEKVLLAITPVYGATVIALVTKVSESMSPIL